MSTEKKNIGKSYFDPNFKPDIVPEFRQRVMDYFHLNFFPHLYQYYQSKKSEIKKYFPDIEEQIETLIKENNLKEKGVIDNNIYDQIFDLIEYTGQELDQFGMLKERKDYDAELENIKSYYENEYKFTDWSLLFKFPILMFDEGHVNLCIGGMGEGKSNMLLEMGLAITEASNNFELVTNFKLKGMKKVSNIHFVVNMKNLLMLVCQNAIKNYEHINNGNEHLCKRIIAIIDEGENFVVSQRSGSSEVVDFNKIMNMFRKLFTSVTLVFHRWDDIPKVIRKNPSLNSIIYKNSDKEGNKVGLQIDQVVIELLQKDQLLYIKNIPRSPYLDSRHKSTFCILDKYNTSNSVDIDEILNEASKWDGEQAPKQILKILERVDLENIPESELIKTISRIDTICRDQIIFCKNKIDYQNIVTREVRKFYNSDDLSVIKGLKTKIADIVSETWSITKVNEQIDKAFQVEKKDQDIKEIKDIDYEISEKEELLKLLTYYSNKQLVEIVNGSYRIYTSKEFNYLLNNKISKSKLKTLYGQSNEVKEKLNGISEKENIDYIICKKEKLLEYLNYFNKKQLSEIIKEEHRSFSEKEFNYLYNKLIPISKLKILYGNNKEVLKKLNKTTKEEKFISEEIKKITKTSKK